MAQGTSALCLLALVMALVGSGCGGGSASRSTGTDSSSADDASVSQGGLAALGGQAKARSHHGADAKAVHVVPMGGGREPGVTAAQRANATAATIELSSPAAQAGSTSAGELPAAFTCDGADRSPPLRWHAVPSGTAELALFVMNAKPIDGELFFDWAVAGIDPKSKGLRAGQTATGAIVGRNASGDVGYSICPPKGAEETYIFALYALPRRLSPQPGFNPASLRTQAVSASREAGLLAVTYQQR